MSNETAVFVEKMFSLEKNLIKFNMRIIYIWVSYTVFNYREIDRITIYTPTISIYKGWKVKCRVILLYWEDSRLRDSKQHHFY